MKISDIWQRTTRVARAVQLAYQRPRAPAGYEPQELPVSQPRLLYQARRYHGYSHVREMLIVLLPQLYERQWNDLQCWSMLYWDQLLQQVRSYLPQWLEHEGEIPNWLRNLLVSELRQRGYSVQLPLPPQTNNSAIISWRADLYFNNNR